MRRYLRFVRYLGVQCTALRDGRPHPRPLAGKTRCVGAGGLEILLPEGLPLHIPVLVQIDQGEPLHGRIIWVGQGTPTLLGTRFPHGVAFEQPVDPALVRQWVSQAKRRSHPRARVRCEVEYTHAGSTTHGTCLNLGRGGMFIGTDRPATPETEILLYFTPPGLDHPLSVRVRVVWICAEETGPSAITGMGVQFRDPKPSETAVIGTLVDRLREKASPLRDSSRLLPPSR